VAQKYRKKPVVVEAIQYTNLNKREVDVFVGETLNREFESETAYLAGKGFPVYSLLINTKEGVMKAYPGDWIIKEPFPTDDRKFYPCKPDIFEETYEGFIETEFPMQVVTHISVPELSAEQREYLQELIERFKNQHFVIKQTEIKK